MSNRFHVVAMIIVAWTRSESSRPIRSQRSKLHQLLRDIFSSMRSCGMIWRMSPAQHMDRAREAFLMVDAREAAAQIARRRHTCGSLPGRQPMNEAGPDPLGSRTRRYRATSRSRHSKISWRFGCRLRSLSPCALASSLHPGGKIVDRSAERAPESSCGPLRTTSIRLRLGAARRSRPRRVPLPRDATPCRQARGRDRLRRRRSWQRLREIRQAGRGRGQGYRTALVTDCQRNCTAE